jgi:hypothetical protein
MYFYPVYKHPGAVSYWTFDASQQVLPEDAVGQPVCIEGDRHHILPAVARMVLAFTKDPEERTKLDQDCAAFALACTTQNDLSGVAFRRTRNSPRIVHGRIDPISDAAVEDLPAGAILFSSKGPFLQALGDHHYAVVASCGAGGKQILASKLGSRGPVVLSSYQQLSERYAHGVVGVVRGLHMYAIR